MHHIDAEEERYMASTLNFLSELFSLHWPKPPWVVISVADVHTVGVSSILRNHSHLSPRLALNIVCSLSRVKPQRDCDAPVIYGSMGGPGDLWWSLEGRGVPIYI